MGNLPENFAKILMFMGAILLFTGAAFLVLGKMGFFRLPGDIEMTGKNWRLFFPITSCIVISIVLTLVFWLISFLRK
jgi:ribose/xylose/arabinose/galactoside ABC-type transport system permease subunit